MSAPEVCEFYQEIGSGCCDGCGGKASEHKGVRAFRKGASPFSGEDCWERLTWPEWRERVELSRREYEARKRLRELPAETAIGLVESLSEPRA